jgi:hypothetical protein
LASSQGFGFEIDTLGFDAQDLNVGILQGLLGLRYRSGLGFGEARRDLGRVLVENSGA